MSQSKLNAPIIIDVRTPEEFAEGANPASINIPLNELAEKIASLNAKHSFVVCCASGGRSAMAMSLLKKQGFNEVVNAGPWQNTLKMGR